MPTANVVNGVLAIQGTNRNDVIDVSSDGTNYTVTINGQASMFTVAGVQSIDVKCSSGNDQVTIAQNVLVSCRVDGGNGNDVIHGGGGDDTLIGGNGKDQIDGGGGNDHISGGNGNDRLSGSDGNDSISGGNGDDVLHGDVGNDDLHGENGRDQLFGDDGNDLCDGGRGQNLLQGDNGHDVYFDHHGDSLNTDTDDDQQEDGFQVSANQTELEMSLHSGTLFAKVNFESETENGQTERTFRVEVFGGTTGATLDVIVGGTTVGHITVDAEGRGQLRFTDGGGGGDPFPLNFPSITSGFPFQSVQPAASCRRQPPAV